MDFMTAVKTCFGKYANFTGRAARSEFWFFTLFQILASIVASLIDGVLFGVMLFYALTALALLLPGLAVAVRRLHDTGRSGWWYLLILFPLVGPIVLLIWFCTKGSDSPNRFGDDPLSGGNAPAAVTA